MNIMKITGTILKKILKPLLFVYSYEDIGEDNPHVNDSYNTNIYFYEI